MANYDTLYEQIHTCANLLHRGAHFARRETYTEGNPPPHRGQGRVLRALLEQDGIAQKELVEILDIRPSSVGELVDKLEQAGLVRRSQGEEDKRVSIVQLTEEGRARAEGMHTGREALLGGMFTGLSEEEQADLLRLLTKLNESLKQQFPTAPDRPESDPRHCPHHRGPHPGPHGRGPGPRERGFGPDPRGPHGFGPGHYGGPPRPPEEEA